MELQEFFQEHKKVAVALSGGVDSGFLLYQAKKYAKDVKAYFVNSVFQPSFELEDAKRLCKELKTELAVLEADVLSDKNIKSNPPNRCYYCKKYLFQEIVKAAGRDGYPAVVDGTNGSDEESDRPGMKALKEADVMSPLRLCKITKDEIRIKARKSGIFLHDKPSYACLATRIPPNNEITGDMLNQIQEGEDFLFSLGFTDFRIRWFFGSAKIQLLKGQLPLFLEKREEILKKLEPVFKEVLLDLKTRKESC